MLDYTRTAHDAIDYMLSSVGGGAQDSENRAVREAVFRGYEEVLNERQWLWHVSSSSVAILPNVTEYLLPADMFSVDSMLTENRLTIGTYVTPYEWKQLDTSKLANGQPLFWTVMRSESPATFDRWVLRVAGTPAQSQTFRFTYRRRPKPLRYTGLESRMRQGTVSCSGTAVIGVGTDFPGDAVGSVIRFGTADNDPEPLSGLHSYRDQARIASIASATSLTLAAAAETATAVRYCITDLLDMSPTMYRAMLSASEQWYARLMGRDVAGALAVYQRDLRKAFEQDVVAPLSGQRGGTGQLGPRAFGWGSPSLPDTGVL